MPLLVGVTGFVICERLLGACHVFISDGIGVRSAANFHWNDNYLKGDKFMCYVCHPLIWSIFPHCCHTSSIASHSDLLPLVFPMFHGLARLMSWSTQIFFFSE